MVLESYSSLKNNRNIWMISDVENSILAIFYGPTPQICKKCCVLWLSLPHENLILYILKWHFTSQVISLLIGRARLDWAYEFPDRTGPDTQICQTRLNPDFYFLNILQEQLLLDNFPVHKFGGKKFKKNFLKILKKIFGVFFLYFFLLLLKCPVR